MKEKLIHELKRGKSQNLLHTSHNSGITLVALIITIIVLLILAVVAIRAVQGDGIISKAKESQTKYERAQAEEKSQLSQMKNQLQNMTDNGFEKSKNVNRPQLTTGMTRVMYNNGQTILDGQTGWDEENWYNYESKNWANAQTKDGSMWVWIPRFAYKITYTNSSNKSAGGTIDVVFLKGTTNLDKDGKDVTSESYVNEKNVQGAYIVHPCFKNGSSRNYANGEWKEEITGFWISKFEAGLPDESSAPRTSSVANMYYPVFQGQKGSYNYVNVSQCFQLSQAISENGNPYGITNADSHLVKNSEWGAVAYLSYSKYGKTEGSYNKDKEVYINNVTYAERGTISPKTSIRNRGVYSVTGYAGSSKSAGQNILTGAKLADVVNGKAGKSYAWYTNNGTLASTTGTIYGIYDMSGGAAEYTSSYINLSTQTGALQSNGKAFVFKKTENGDLDYDSRVGNTPYVMEYPNYAANGLKTALESTERYGDGYLETWGWFEDWTNNDASGPFTTRGANLNYGPSAAGVFAFDDESGGGSYYLRFPFCVSCAVAL